VSLQVASNTVTETRQIETRHDCTAEGLLDQMDIRGGLEEGHRQMLIELIDLYSGAFSKYESDLE